MARKVTITFSVLFLVGWFILFVDEPLRYPANGKTFLSLFQLPSIWMFIIYLLFADFLVSTAIIGGRGIRFLFLSLAVFLPLLYFLQEFFAEAVYCLGNFCGDVYPPTAMSYLGVGFVSSAIVFKFGFLIHQIINCLMSKQGKAV